MPKSRIPPDLRDRNWPYADGAGEAIARISERIARTARRGSTISYSEVVKGIELRLPNVERGHPFELGVPEWRDLDRAILGEILGKISLDTYAKHGFLASAVVTSKSSGEPSEGFWLLVEELGLFRGRDETARVLFWADELRKVQEWCAAHS